MFNRVINGEKYICRLCKLYDKINGSKFWLPLSILSIIVGFILFFFLVIPLFGILSLSLSSTFLHFLPSYVSFGVLEIAPLFYIISTSLFLIIGKYNNIFEKHEISDIFMMNYIVISVAIIVAILLICYNRSGITYIR